MFRKPWATVLTVGVMAVALALPLGCGLALGNVERFAGERAAVARRSACSSSRDTVDARAARAGRRNCAARGDVAAVELRTPRAGPGRAARTRAASARRSTRLGDNPLPSVLLVTPAGDETLLAASLRQLPEADLVQHDARLAAAPRRLAALRRAPGAGCWRRCSGWARCWWSATPCAWTSSRGARRSACCSCSAPPTASSAGRSCISVRGTGWPRARSRSALLTRRRAGAARAAGANSPRSYGSALRAAAASIARRAIGAALLAGSARGLASAGCGDAAYGLTGALILSARLAAPTVDAELRRMTQHDLRHLDQRPRRGSWWWTAPSWCAR